MPETNKKPIIVGLLIAAALVIVVGFFFLINSQTQEWATNTQPMNEAMDVTSDFYSNWLEASKNGSIDALVSSLATSTLINASVQSHIVSALQDTADSVDPVLCQSTPPERFGIKPSFENDRSAQYLVLARGGEVKSPNLAVVDLALVDNAWQITNIACSTGESGPEREFTFEREGYLLKNVPAPLNAEYWHLVFEEGGQMGYTAPLFFGAESRCVSANGTESVCDTATFAEATKVTVRGEMTEAGVEVKRVNF